MNTVCDICSECHETRMHGIEKLTAKEFYAKHYSKVCHNFLDYMEFAEAYANAKRNGIKGGVRS